MYTKLHYIGLLLFVLYFTFLYHKQYKNIEYFEEKKTDCNCDDTKSLINLVAQYNILDNKINDINKKLDELKTINTLINKNKQGISSNKKDIAEIRKEMIGFSKIMSK